MYSFVRAKSMLCIAPRYMEKDVRMRVSKRNLILEGIIKVVQRDGMTGLTFDAVAAETGVTRGGLLYHFPSRDALIQAVHEHAIAVWESMLGDKLGTSREAATTQQRASAYIQVAIHAANRADLALLLESAVDEKMGQLWLDAYDRWVDPAPDPDDDASIRRFIGRLAADGLWMHDALLLRPLSPQLKNRIVQQLVAMME